MAHRQELISLESLIPNAQREFVKNRLSTFSIPAGSRFKQISNRLSSFQLNGQYCDMTLISSDKTNFKVNNKQSNYLSI